MALRYLCPCRYVGSFVSFYGALVEIAAILLCVLAGSTMHYVLPGSMKAVIACRHAVDLIKPRPL